MQYNLLAISILKKLVISFWPEASADAFFFLLQFYSIQKSFLRQNFQWNQLDFAQVNTTERIKPFVTNF